MSNKTKTQIIPKSTKITGITELLANLPKNERYITIPPKNFINLIGIENFSKLLYLDFHNNNIYNLNILTLLPNLKHLNCSNNNVSNLPENMPKLQELICSNNNITYIPSSYSEKLTKLICDFNRITEIEEMPKLKILNCNNNEIIKLPNYIRHLQTLSCDNNNLIELPELPELTHLSCNYNKIIKLPEQVSKNIFDVRCCNNKIEKIPESYKDVRILHCYYNKINEMPNELTNVISLLCNNNKLSSLPLKMNNIEILNCANNEITKLPGEYLLKSKNKFENSEQLLKLEKLYCENNKLLLLPILGHSLKTINTLNNNLPPELNINVHIISDTQKNFINNFIDTRYKHSIAIIREFARSSIEKNIMKKNSPYNLYYILDKYGHLPEDELQEIIDRKKWPTPPKYYVPSSKIFDFGIDNKSIKNSLKNKNQSLTSIKKSKSNSKTIKKISNAKINQTI